MSYLNIDALRTIPYMHTNNQWVKADERFAHCNMISNATYSFYYGASTLSQWNREANCLEAISWNLTWYFLTNDPNKNYAILDKETKRFATEELMNDFIQDLKQRYSKYFTEIYPPIMHQYKDFYLQNGILPEPYTIKIA